MKVLQLVGLVGVLLLAGCGSGTDDGTATSVATSTTTTSAPAFTSTGSKGLDACIEAILDAVADVDLQAADADSRLDAVLTDGVMTPCDSLAEEKLAADGLDFDLAFEALAESLPPEVMDWLSSPEYIPFENTADEL